ncbi:hypothetical protein GOODEAATRI_020837 [Goodea atripinnis]|uniref:Uncharacterized protein n=1 Tax=Goodea atripinnis TaxID=208336 RepID=A0ABV0PQC8_9TELE
MFKINKGFVFLPYHLLPDFDTILYAKAPEKHLFILLSSSHVVSTHSIHAPSNQPTLIINGLRMWLCGSGKCVYLMVGKHINVGRSKESGPFYSGSLSSVDLQWSENLTCSKGSS